MHIERAKDNDSKALEDFLVNIFGEDDRTLANAYITCSFSNDYHRPIFIVAKSDGHICGAAAFSKEIFTTGLRGISWVSVHKDHRNKGIGEKLVNKCLEEIAHKADEKVNVMLGTYPYKTGLYDKTGFKKLGQSHCGGWFMMTTVGE